MIFLKFFFLFLFLLFIIVLPILGRLWGFDFLRVDPLISLFSVDKPLLFLLPAGLLILTIIFGRFFCRWVCPLGILLDIFSRFYKKKPRFRHKNFKFYLLIFIAVVALVSVPFFYLLDPLVILSRILLLFKTIFRPRYLVFLLIFLCILYLKRTWCTHFCPLGTILEIFSKLKRHSGIRPDLSRRKFLGTIGSGVAIALLLKFKKFKTSDRLIRPPGSIDEVDLVKICARCGGCMKVCPNTALHPCFFESGVEGLFTPRLIPRIGYCEEYCNLCGRACPTGAIKKLSVEEKKRVKIGTARINRSRCLSWAERIVCLVCFEHCSYQAIDINEEGYPIVKPTLCRGCGACEYKCPVDGEAAIIVYAQDQI